MLSSFVYGRLRSFDRNPPGSGQAYTLRYEIELGGIETFSQPKTVELPDPSLGRRVFEDIAYALFGQRMGEALRLTASAQADVSARRVELELITMDNLESRMLVRQPGSEIATMWRTELYRAKARPKNHDQMGRLHWRLKDMEYLLPLEWALYHFVDRQAFEGVGKGHTLRGLRSLARKETKSPSLFPITIQNSTDRLPPTLRDFLPHAFTNGERSICLLQTERQLS